jgi:hypothetical protein
VAALNVSAPLCGGVEGQYGHFAPFSEGRHLAMDCLTFVDNGVTLF